MKKGFLQGAVILSGAGILVKVLGALYRIPLARILGGEGMGLYQMAYPIYTSMLAISTAGVPVAISILVAEKLAEGDKQGAYRIFRISLTMLTLTGLIFSFLVFSNAKFLAEKVLGEPRAFFAIAAISPAIFLTAVVSAFRGYFQGYQEMIPTAVSQVVEQLIRVMTVLTGGIILLPHGLKLAAGGATFGAVTGGLAALLVLLIFYKVQNNNNFFQSKGRMGTQDRTWAIVLRIFKIALPLSLGGLVMPLMQAIDALFVPMGLQAADFSPARATELFGQFTGMAGSLINLPSIITVALAVSLVPAVAEALALKKPWLAEKRISASNRLALLLCLPAGAGLGTLATPISLMLYNIAEVGIPLRFLAPAVLFLGLYQTTAGALQGLNKTAYPVINLMLGLIVKSILNYNLTAIPALNIKGAAIATVVAFFVAFSLNYLLLKVKFAMKFRLLKTSIVPLVATGIMVVGTKSIYEILYRQLSNSFATLGSIMAGIIIYFFSLLMLGGLTEDDVVLIPRIGQKIAETLKKISILR